METGLAKNPYTLLGVKKDASDDEISKAFRKLSKKYHPDINDAPDAADKFKEISAAYTLLSDKELRAQYDQGRVDEQGNQKAPDFSGFDFGSAGNANPFGGGGFRYQSSRTGGADDMSDLFSQLFGMDMGARTGGFDRSAYMRPQRGADIAYAMTLDFMDAVKGATKTIIGRDGKSLNVRIPAGVKDGQTLRLKGKGQPGQNGGPRGDARVTVSVRDHKHIRRDGNDLHMRLPITLSEAVLGAKVTVPTPTGDVRLTIPPGTSGGRVFRLKGKGVKTGNLYVKAEVQVPEDDAALKDWAEAHGTDGECAREGLL